MDPVLFWALIGVQVLLFLVGAGLIFFIGYVLWSFKKIVPYVPTPRKVAKAMLTHADIREGDSVIDLGSGDGRLVRHVARTHAVPVTGIDNSPLLHRVSKVLSRLHPSLGHVRLVLDDWHAHPLHGYSRVLLFLTDEGMAALNEKFATELLPGAKMVSYKFRLPDRDGFDERIVDLDYGKNEILYVYTKQ